MVKAAVAGIAGRMGSRIAQLILETDGIELASGFEHPDHPVVGKDIAEAIGGSAFGKPVSARPEDALMEAEVLIDFTNAHASIDHLEAVAEAGKAIVIGSTGFTPEQVKTVRARVMSAGVPCVLAPNMSRGVNILFKLVEEAARLLGPDFEVEIVETHHRHKKDAPSGTALKLAEVAAQALDRDLTKVGRYERHGLIGERPREQIGVQTLRGGDIVGEHAVLFAGMGERIEIGHRAHNRDNFVRGAIHAAKWIVGQPAGLYDMQKVLGIE
jgi:4-hydroxy-tetrahydrodipicolinate reductase